MTTGAGAPERLVDGLRSLRRVLFEYPVAAQAAFAALVAEGRTFAQTAEGAAWKERLEGSELVRNGRVVWEVLTQSSFTEDRETVLPSVVLDTFARSSAVALLEPFLSMVFEEEEA